MYRFIIVFLLICFSTAYANNDTLLFCGKNQLSYCVSFENPDINIKMQSDNRSILSLSFPNHRSKVLVAGRKYKDDYLEEINVNFLKNELFQGWREMDIKNWTTRHSFEQDNTATFIYGSLENNTPMMTYHFVKYDEKNGYVELYAKYPTKHESVIKPMLEQMANSITIQ